MDDDQREVIKVGAEAALRPFADLIDKLFGGAAEEIGGAWQDKLAVRRQIRRIALFKKLQAAIDDAEFEPEQIPDNIWIPALQEASLQDDETLQVTWANLLANAADPRQINPVLPSFSQILKELTAREARFLDFLYKKRLNDPRKRVSSNFNMQPDFTFTWNDLLSGYAETGLSRRPRLFPLSFGDFKEGGDDLQSDLSDFAASIDVLKRNEILRESTIPDSIDVSKIISDVQHNKTFPRSLKATATTRYDLTDLGRQFIKACRAPSR